MESSYGPLSDNDYFSYMREQRVDSAIDGWAREHETAEEAAESAIRSLAELAHTIEDLPVSEEQADPTHALVSEGEDRSMLQGEARLVTWREDAHHRHGYGLALLRPHGGKIEGRMYVVELGRSPMIVREHAVVAESGKNSEIHTQAESLADQVSKDNLDILAAMAHKALLASRGTTPANNFEIMQLLGAEVTSKDQSDINLADTYYPENIFEAGIESMARAAVRKHLGYHEYRKRGPASICLKHELSDKTYYALVESTRPALSHAEREIKEIKVLTRSEESEILVYPPDPTADYDENLSSLVYDVEGVSEMFAHGELQDATRQQEFDLEWRLAKLRLENNPLPYDRESNQDD